MTHTSTITTTTSSSSSIKVTPSTNLSPLRKPAFLKLRAQFVQLQLEEYALESATLAARPNDVTDAFYDILPGVSNELPPSLLADTPSNPFRESPDFVLEEDSTQVSGAQVVPDVDTMGYLTLLPPKHQLLKPQQIAGTEHQCANAFFGLFANDVFPGVELIGNNGVRDPAFEKLLKRRQIQANKRKQKKRIRQQLKHASNKKSKGSTVKKVAKKMSANTKLEGFIQHQKRYIFQNLLQCFDDIGRHSCHCQGDRDIDSSPPNTSN
ncbi:hypothetical protein BGX34_009344 [Mortierella sp. NVP85]|nr:hypothetical protein BGX34_009344 [Mortierella sp. NVP85]